MAGMAGMDGMAMSSDGAARLTADQIRQFGVTFGRVEERTLEDAVRAVGVVVVDESRLEQVAPRFGGYVERLYVEATGAPVRRGQPLMTVYSPELYAAQQELLTAWNLYYPSERNDIPGVPGSSVDLVAAARRRLTLAGMTEAQVDEVLRTGNPQRAVTIFAPASGVVLEKRVVQGQAIQPGEMVYTIANLSRVWVEAELRGVDAAAVRVGTLAEIMVEGLAGRPLEGRVEYVYPTMDAVARTTRARVALANGAGRLRPGMFATVRLTAPVRRALTVPATAVVRTGERAVVFVDMGGGSLMTHEVELGRAAGDYVEILTGVEPGQRVVTSAQYLIDAESNLAEVMRAMMGQMGSGGDMGGMDMGSMPGMDTGGMPAGKGADVKGAMPDMPGMKGIPHDSPPRR
ncbi:MAG TPA: efflux RND transporter periplasmic adaptor subunit [Gemmatimonadaceae bacterium]|nr:efflux RND transporter periplasmic adaptor subunit [Gemmatimonadaceae bacterium]